MIFDYGLDVEKKRINIRAQPRALSQFGSSLSTSGAAARIFQRLPQAHDRIAMQQNSNYNRSRATRRSCSTNSKVLEGGRAPGMCAKADTRVFRAAL